MRRILHISDLHFGRTNDALVEALRRKAHDLTPDLVVISGDLTQRAREREFIQARGFLQSLHCPTVVIPGNHDIPLYNVFARFFRPLTNYRKYISSDPWPSYEDNELLVLGMNTARSFARAGGRISDRQIDYARGFFCKADHRLIKILVTHHPFDFPPSISDKHLVRRARHAIAALGACDADVYLAGHAHVPFAGLTARRYKAPHRTALVVQAGTGVSTRTRSEPNSFNVLLIRRPYISVQHFGWDAQKSDFLGGFTAHFKDTEQGWESASTGGETRETVAWFS